MAKVNIVSTEDILLDDETNAKIDALLPKPKPLSVVRPMNFSSAAEKLIWEVVDRQKEIHAQMGITLRQLYFIHKEHIDQVIEFKRMIGSAEKGDKNLHDRLEEVENYEPRLRSLIDQAVINLKNFNERFNDE